MRGSVLFSVLVVAAALASAPALAARATGDFDGNGFSDLAIGAPADEVSGHTNAGAVYVIYGGPGRFGASSMKQRWTQDVIASDTTENGDGFGGVLATGDFDGDGFSDLAVGVPGDSVGPTLTAGYVHVIYGSSTGLTDDGSQLFSENETGVSNPAGTADHFGAALAAGNFGKGGRDDLAIGIPGDDYAAPVSGSVEILYGSSTGLSPTGAQVWTQNSSGIKSSSAANELFGNELAAANFGKGQQADLAVGVPSETLGTATSFFGAVNVIYGSASGLRAAGNQLWSQGSPGVADRPEEYDDFGASLAAANFGRGSTADLAVGVPRENDDAGAVHVLYGSSVGLRASGDQLFHQGTRGIAGARRAGSGFGRALTAANFGRTSEADLAIGALAARVGGIQSVGSVNVLYGSATGLHAARSQFWHQNVSGVNGSNAEGDHFGWAVGGGNFGASKQADLAVGVANDTVGSAIGVGAVQVLYGRAGGLSAYQDRLLDKTWWPGATPAFQDFFGGSLAPRR